MALFDFLDWMNQCHISGEVVMLRKMYLFYSCFFSNDFVWASVHGQHATILDVTDTQIKIKPSLHEFCPHYMIKTSMLYGTETQFFPLLQNVQMML